MAELPKVAWIALAGLAGCGANISEPAPAPNRGPSSTAVADPAPSPSAQNGANPPTENGVNPNADPAAAVAAIDENLARLRSLDVFEVGDLIVQMPAEALNCYGAKPCAGSESAVAAARAVAAERLATFTNEVVKAAAMPYDSYACEAHVDINLDALRALNVVDIGNLVVSQPQNNQSCYNLPCQSDIDAANQANHTRAAKLEIISLALPEP
jgi:hypothetical protein